MLLRFRHSEPAVVEQRSAGNRWQAVALEVAEGVGKAASKPTPALDSSDT
jgi:hypothetical protein